MRKIAIVGAGKIGSTVVDLLLGSGDYRALVIDRSEDALAGIATDERLATLAMAIDDTERLTTALAGCFAVINCAPYHLTTVVARASSRSQSQRRSTSSDARALRTGVNSLSTRKMNSNAEVKVTMPAKLCR